MEVSRGPFAYTGARRTVLKPVMGYEKGLLDEKSILSITKPPE
jgi:hypothetical protein